MSGKTQGKKKAAPKRPHKGKSFTQPAMPGERYDSEGRVIRGREGAKRPKNHETILAFSQRVIAEKFGDQLKEEFGDDYAENWHPAVFLTISSANPELSWDQRAQAARAVMPYMLPALKSVEVSGDKENPLVVEVKEARRNIFTKLGMTEYLDEEGNINQAAILGSVDE